MTLTSIITHDLSKQYGQHLALDQVSITVDQGDIYGLIGRNGAGKTTLLKILSKQIKPSSGSFEILDHPHPNDSDRGLRIGTMIESPGIYPDMTAYSNMRLKCEAMGIRRKNYIEDLLALVELSDVAKKKRASNFSLGMKQRLSLALALVGDPDILLLDEPTNGMDPQGIADFRQLILKLNRERKMTIMVSSHILSELYRLINKVGIIHEGRLLKQVTKEELMQENRDKLILKAKDLAVVTAFLEDQVKVTDYLVVGPDQLEIYEHINEPHIISHALIEAGIKFDTLSHHENSLEDYYMKLTGGVDHA